MYTLYYYKRLQSKWLKGQVRNLTLVQTIRYSAILKEVLGEKTLVYSRNVDWKD